MSSEKHQVQKERLHPRNKNRENYDLNALLAVSPELKSYIKPNKFGTESIDFSNASAVKLLNKAVLNHYYGIRNWEFPDENLCPPIPGRADYIHHMADLLSESNSGVKPISDKITGLDIGTGASCIYPIIGVAEYGWRFIGSDIDAKSIASAENIVNSNPTLKGKIACRLQQHPENTLRGIIDTEDKIDFTVCNPPFHSSIEEARQGTRRKIKNLSGKKVKTPELNFAGVNNELIYEGGELQFIHNMIGESKDFSKSCYWFSTLVSKQSNLKEIYRLLEKAKPVRIKTIPMGTGNKLSRVVAWTFLSSEEQKDWAEARWRPA